MDTTLLRKLASWVISYLPMYLRVIGKSLLLCPQNVRRLDLQVMMLTLKLLIDANGLMWSRIFESQCNCYFEWNGSTTVWGINFYIQQDYRNCLL